MEDGLGGSTSRCGLIVQPGGFPFWIGGGSGDGAGRMTEAAAHLGCMYGM